MKANLPFILLIVLLLSGFSISVYLLFHHFDLVFFDASGPDICSAIFGRGCDAALTSSFSEWLGIPLAGWGILYYVLLATLFILGESLGLSFRADARLLARWVAVTGAVISMLLLVLLLLQPSIFCPLCATIHLINLLLLYPIFRLSGPSLVEGGVALKKAWQFIISGKTENALQARRHTVAFVLVLFVGLAFYQWIRLQEAAYREAAEASFTPDLIIEEFMQAEVQQITPEKSGLTAGSPDAPVRMVVFSDFQCPACRDFSAVAAQLFLNFSDRMQLTFKHFPLSDACNSVVPADVHPRACAAARAAQAAARQGQFWPYHDALFNTDLGKAGQDIFFSLARRLGLDEAQFRKDFSSESVLEERSSDIAEGQRLNLQGTPAVFLNGRRVTNLSPRTLRLLINFLYYKER